MAASPTNPRPPASTASASASDLASRRQGPQRAGLVSNWQLHVLRFLAMMPRSLVRAALVLSLAVAGCGGNGGAPAPVPFSNVGSDVVDIVCTRAALCGTFPDKQTCVASNTVDLGQLSAD